MARNAVEEIPASNSFKHKQFVLINLLKAGAAQLIVLHHLAFYGPMADQARPLMPSLIDWLSGDARIAVQVFLVVGGFLAAKSLAPRGDPGIRHPARAIWRRYLKLAPPFIAATLLAVIASAWASAWMTHDSISPPPSLGQLWAHLLLLHSVLDVESLSAGAWYVAIDFQLYALLVLLSWIAGHVAGTRPRPWLLPVLVVTVASASLLGFNRDPDWDVWAPYFFGSYGLGILAWWASDPGRRPASVVLLLAMMFVPALLALALDFRSRIALALIVACVLFLFGRARAGTCAGKAQSLINKAGMISFSVFLVHFPVCLLVNAAFARFVPAQPQAQAFGMLLAWGVSLAAGAAFFRWVEGPLGRMLTRSRPARLEHPLAAKA